MTCKEIKDFLDKEAGFDISEKKRLLEFIKFRWLYYHFCVRYSTDGLSYQRIGNVIGMVHATVLHGLNSFNNYYETDKDFSKWVNEIESKILKIIPKKEIKKVSKLDSMDVLKMRLVIKRQSKKIHQLMNKSA